MNPAVKIMVASGSETGESVAALSDVEAKYFLTKPYTAKTLLSTLRMLLDEDADALVSPSGAA